MSTSYTRLKVGFTTLLAVIILFSGSLWVKRFNPLQETITYKILFNDANGISAGDPVNVAGIAVGQVTEVQLNKENLALVSFSIQESIDIHPDFSITVQDIGLMGDKALLLIPGIESGVIDHTAIHNGDNPFSMADLMSRSSQILNDLASISSKINNDFDISRIMNTYEETAQKVRELAEAYSSLAEENSDDLSKVLSTVSETSSQINTFMTSTDNNIDDALVSFEHTSAQLSNAIISFNSLTDSISLNLYSQDNTLSKLLTSDELYEELRNTNREIESFLSDFRADPGKYTNQMEFKIRLF